MRLFGRDISDIVDNDLSDRIWPMLKTDKPALHEGDGRLLHPLSFVAPNQAIVKDSFSERILDG
jgi:hypothetical protein